jgi:uncharacterized protein YjbJ (UPF0337 family)
MSSFIIERGSPAADDFLADHQRYVGNRKARRKGNLPRKRNGATPYGKRALSAHRATAAPAAKKESHMNWDRVQGNWKQLTGKVKEQWGKLTEDDITVINGKQDQLVGRIQERYGIAKDEAQRQVDGWINRM